MNSVLLAGPPGANWKSFLRERPGDLLILDPGVSDFGAPGRALLVREGKVVAWRFIGSLDGSRNPLAVVLALHSLLPLAQGKELMVQLFPLRPTPVSRQLALACAQILSPSRVLVPKGSGVDRLGWPVGGEEIELEKPAPPVVALAQRKARWIELWDKGDPHEVSWANVQLEGCRLGAGEPVEARGDVWAEKQGASLFVVSPEPLAGPEQARLLEASGASRVILASPSDYQGLLCSFADQDGSDFALAVLQQVDLKGRRFLFRSPAVPPAPIRILKIGSARINRAGDDLEEARPWSV